jgi:hypothetical protein
MVRVQNMRERIPITFWGVGGIRRKIAVSVYMGLVPISPKTSPMDLTTPCMKNFSPGISS